LGTLHISGTVEARNFKFGTEIGYRETLKNYAKLGQKGSISGHVKYFLQFWDPLPISGTAEARNFNFGTQIGHWGS